MVFVQLSTNCELENFIIVHFFYKLYVFLTPPPLPGELQVHAGAAGCLEQTNNQGNPQ